VRELYNAIARILALGDTPTLRRTLHVAQGGEHAHDLLERVLGMDLSLPAARKVMVEEFERRYLARVLANNDGSIARAAAASGVARRYFEVLRAKRKS
jgi:DNA-binding NtrC family response regulator